MPKVGHAEETRPDWPAVDERWPSAGTPWARQGRPYPAAQYDSFPEYRGVGHEDWSRPLVAGQPSHVQRLVLVHCEREPTSPSPVTQGLALEFADA